MKIPEVASRIREIAVEIEPNYPTLTTELLALADELKRRSPNVRSSITSAHITPKLAAEIREYADVNPHISHQSIAKKFNVNPGRVSETLRGKRT